MGDFIQALITYKKILDSVLADKQNGINEAECRLYLIHCYQALGYHKEVVMHCDAILNMNVQKEIEEHIKAHRKKAAQYKNQSFEVLEVTRNNRGRDDFERATTGD